MAMSNRWYVYIVACSDGTLYTGITNDRARRLKEHNAGSGAKYTRARLPVRLVYSEAKRGRSAASKREAKIKGLTRREKIQLCAR